MKKILFKGKRKVNGKWIISDCIQQTNYSGTHLWYQGYWVEVLPETVGQYTGRNCYSDKDDNLHKIFEGDICNVTTFDCNGTDYHHTCKVEWCDGGFALTNSKKDFFKWLGEIGDTESDLTLLGNIHNNPELIKKV